MVAERFGTPCYVYDEPTLRALARVVRGFDAPYGLGARFAVKANPSRAVLRVFADEGLHFDASTLHEAARVVAAGIPPERVQLTAQVLDDGFEELASRGMLVTACSLRQLDRLGEAFPGGRIGVRINPGEGSGANNRTSVAGPDASFGIWHEQLPEARRIAEGHDLVVTWAHHHVGSGGDPHRWALIAQRTLALLDGFPDVERVNFGGGFKVARVPGETQMDLARAAREVREALERFAARTGRRLGLEIEPGTFLAANAGVLLARVRDVVSTGPEGHVFVKVDAGMAEILRPSLYGAQHPIEFQPGTDEAPLGSPRPLLVVGPCCESGDLLTPAPGDPEALGERTLPLPRAGDLCVIGGAGAYCAAMAARNYNSIPAAPEVLRRGPGDHTLVRRRQTLSDVFREETA